MSSKEYVFLEKKTLYNKKRYYVKDRIKIICIGGENMPKEEPKLIFVKTPTIPKMSKGKTGRDWTAILAKIPDGESLVVPKELASNATIRIAVKNINEEIGEKVYTVTQRTVDEITTVYVIRN